MLIGRKKRNLKTSNLQEKIYKVHNKIHDSKSTCIQEINGDKGRQENTKEAKNRQVNVKKEIRNPIPLRH